MIDGPDCSLWVETEGSGQPVTVFAHGVTSSVAELQPLAARAPGTRVLFDFRGHGRSESPPEAAGYDHRDLAKRQQTRRPTSIAQILLASNKRIESQSNQTQSSAALCPCPDPQRSGRSFGDSSVRELAYDILRILPSISR